ncbi:MAG TPA: HAD-IC family P-type ATPase, partial [Anaerolineaceae bacterium]
LTFKGLIGFADPPRPEAMEAVAVCRRAGVRVIMVTSDHPLTARAVARQVGLDGDLAVITGPELDQLIGDGLLSAVRQASIFARTTPEHKLRIVQALQALGERVAVTGDGVNDAPALAAADIGVAMGETGTDVARESAAMVLSDDNFATILHAVEEGRLIYENLKKGVRYYLSCKVALVLSTLLPALLLVPVPFAPVQIILMELFMDLMAAAAFVGEAAEADLLDRKPRSPRDRFMDRAMIGSILISSFGLFAAVTAVYLSNWYATGDLASSQTAAFFTWLIGHVLLAFNMRSERQPLFSLGLASNRTMLLWAGSVAAFLAVVSLIPAAHPLMRVVDLSASRWAGILLAAVAGTFWLEVLKLVRRR